MRLNVILLVLLLNIFLVTDSWAQVMPLVYDVENTGADFPKPTMLTISQLPSIPNLPDPFEWSDGRGRISNLSDWRYRRAEIKSEIENYEIGEKPPRPDSIQASYANNTLTVIVTRNGKTLTLTSQIVLPTGTGPFPAVIGMNSGSGSIPSNIFSSRNIAQITFNHNQVTSYGSPQITNPYYQLYPNLNTSNTGQYSAWAWGVSRIIDGLELVQNVLPIDIKHLAVTGCSYAGKMAIFCGAFDERIALTIGQESGGGGYTTWRYSQEVDKTQSVETLGKTDYNWFKDAMRQFAGDVSKMPEDHHELMAMVAPRALLVTGNPDYIWLADESGHVGSKAAKEVWNALGVPDRFGFSIVSGHSHCAVPNSQIPEIEAFVDKFLLGKTTVNTNIATTPYNTNLAAWVTWTTPALGNGTSPINWASLSYPSDTQSGLGESINFSWKKVQDAKKYFIEVSVDPGFKSLDFSDSTGTDTVITVTGLLKGKVYYWHVKVVSNVGVDLWSNIWSFRTITPIPATPQLVSAAPTYATRTDHFTFKWNKVEYADQYTYQISKDQAFATIFKEGTTIDSSRGISGFVVGDSYYWRVQASGFSGSSPWSNTGNFTVVVTGVNEEQSIPKEYSLSQNYPNPFNPATTINFALPHSAITRITIYDLLGREIQTLLNGQVEAGYHEINFNAGGFQSGVYFYRIQSGDFNQTKKMILMK